MDARPLGIAISVVGHMQPQYNKLQTENTPEYVHDA
jgi:hypothetical protein